MNVNELPADIPNVWPNIILRDKDFMNVDFPPAFGPVIKTFNGSLLPIPILLPITSPFKIGYHISLALTKGVKLLLSYSGKQYPPSLYKVAIDKYVSEVAINLRISKRF